MQNFIEALQNGKGFNFLSNYEQYNELSKDDLRNIAKELIYAIEENRDILKSEKASIFDAAIEELENYI